MKTKKWPVVGVLLVIFIISLMGWQALKRDKPSPVVNENLVIEPRETDTEKMLAPHQDDLPNTEHKSEQAPEEEHRIEAALASQAHVDEAGGLYRDLEEMGLLARPALNSNAELSEWLQEFLELSEEQVARLNDIVGESAEILGALELQQMEVSQKSPNEVLVSIPPLGAQPLELKGALREAFQEELGHSDGELLWDLMTVGIASRSFWSEFGQNGVEMNISIVPQESGMRYKIERQFSDRLPSIGGTQLPQSLSMSGRAFSSEDTRKALERHLGRQGYILDHLPDDFQNRLGEKPR